MSNFKERLEALKNKERKEKEASEAAKAPPLEKKSSSKVQAWLAAKKGSLSSSGESSTGLVDVKTEGQGASAAGSEKPALRRKSSGKISELSQRFEKSISGSLEPSVSSSASQTGRGQKDTGGAYEALERQTSDQSVSSSGSNAPAMPPRPAKSLSLKSSTSSELPLDSPQSVTSSGSSKRKMSNKIAQLSQRFSKSSDMSDDGADDDSSSKPALGAKSATETVPKSDSKETSDKIAEQVSAAECTSDNLKASCKDGGETPAPDSKSADDENVAEEPIKPKPQGVSALAAKLGNIPLGGVARPLPTKTKQKDGDDCEKDHGKPNKETGKADSSSENSKAHQPEAVKQGEAIGKPGSSTSSSKGRGKGVSALAAKLQLGGAIPIGGMGMPPPKLNRKKDSEQDEDNGEMGESQDNGSEDKSDAEQDNANKMTHLSMGRPTMKNSGRRRPKSIKSVALVTIAANKMTSAPELRSVKSANDIAVMPIDILNADIQGGRASASLDNHMALSRPIVSRGRRRPRSGKVRSLALASLVKTESKKALEAKDVKTNGSGQGEACNVERPANKDEDKEDNASSESGHQDKGEQQDRNEEEQSADQKISNSSGDEQSATSAEAASDVDRRETVKEEEGPSEGESTDEDDLI